MLNSLRRHWQEYLIEARGLGAFMISACAFGVLLEPMTVVQKGITQAFETQRRLKVWKPKRAAVLGAGTIGLLATLVFKLKGMEVVTFGRTPKPFRLSL